MKISTYQTPIFTLDAMDLESEEGRDYRETIKIYYDQEEALADGKALQKENQDLLVSVVLGEYETSEGNIFGEPFLLPVNEL